jgi:hypothetical protein
MAYTLYLFIIIVLAPAKLLPPGDAFDFVFAIGFLIMTVFVLISMYHVVIGFVRWMWFNRT